MRNPSQYFATNSWEFISKLPTWKPPGVNIVVYTPKLYRRSFFCSPKRDNPEKRRCLGLIALRLRHGLTYELFQSGRPAL